MSMYEVIRVAWSSSHWVLNQWTESIAKGALKWIHFHRNTFTLHTLSNLLSLHGKQEQATCLFKVFIMFSGKIHRFLWFSKIKFKPLLTKFLEILYRKIKNSTQVLNCSLSLNFIQIKFLVRIFNPICFIVIKFMLE